MIKQHLKIGYRNLVKHKSISIVNVMGLSIAMAACLVIFFYIQYEFGYEKNWKNSDNIYRINYNRYQNGDLSFKSAKALWKMGRVIKDEIPGVTAYTEVFHDIVAVYTPENQIQDIKMYGTDSTFVDVFKLDYLSKKGNNPLTGLHSSLISESAAKRLFGDVNVLGKWFKVNQSWEFEVTGVYKDLPQNSHFRFDLLLSVQTYYYYFSNKNDSAFKAENEKRRAQVKAWEWGYNGVYSYLVLQKNAEPEMVEKQINNISAKYLQKLIQDNGKAEFFLQPVRDIHLKSHFDNEMGTNSDIKYIIVLAVIGIIILVIAWINFINLTLARALERTKETGIRQVHGASRFQIINQYLVEYSIINILSVFIALIIAGLSWSVFGNMLGKASSVSELNNPVLWLILFILFVAGVLLSGFYPAFIQSGNKTYSSLYSNNVPQGNKLGLRKILVIGQFCASIVLITGVLVVFRQISYMRSQDLGINIENTLVTFSPMGEIGKVVSKLQTYKTRLKAVPGIESVTTSSAIPGCAVLLERQDIRKPDDMSNTFKSYAFIYIDEDFIDSYNLKLLEGRNFTNSLEAESHNLILNETAANQLGYKDARSAIDSYVMIGDKKFQIIGIVKNYNQESLQKEIKPIVFFYGYKWYCDIGYFSIKINRANISSAISDIQNIWQEVFPLDRFEYFFLKDSFNNQYLKEYQFGKIFGFFTLLAIFITSIGLYGLTAYATLKRRKEIGLRKINGATSLSILFFLLKDYAHLVIIAFVFACPASYTLIQNWLQNYAYKTEVSWWILAVAGLLSMLIALVTITTHAWKVSASNPVLALKHE